MLHACLADLASSASATTAAVFDAWGLPWCCAPLHNIFVARECASVLRRAFANLKTPLEQGGSLDRICSTDGVGAAYVRSFASVYILILRYDALFDLQLAKRTVAMALPEIEARVVALPPPHGPGSGSAEARGKP